MHGYGAILLLAYAFHNGNMVGARAAVMVVKPDIIPFVGDVGVGFEIAAAADQPVAGLAAVCSCPGLGAVAFALA